MLRHAVDGSLRNLKTRVVSHRVTHGTGGVEHHDDVGRGHGRLRRAGLRAGHVQGQVIGAIIVRLDVLAVPGRRDDRVRHRGTWHLTDRHRLRGRRILLLRHLDLTAIGAHRIRVWSALISVTLYFEDSVILLASLPKSTAYWPALSVITPLESVVRVSPSLVPVAVLYTSYLPVYNV